MALEGLHHITAITGDAPRNVDFYARLLGLRPVSYRYKAAFGPLGSTAPQYGLIAEQVARTFPELVQRGPDGKPTGVYYQQLPVLLLAQVQDQRRRLDGQRRTIASLRAHARSQQAQIDWLVRHARHGR